MTQEMEKLELVVDGRTFIQEPPTFEQEIYILQRVVESGFDTPDVTLGFDPQSKDLTHSAKLLIIHAYKSGTLFDLLGALMTEKGKDWSPESAKEAGELFKHTRDRDAKYQLHPALVAAVTAFFLSAKGSEMTSPISSDESGVSLRPKESVTPRLTETQAGEVFRSGNMPSSSEKSPSTKRQSSKTSSRGKSAKA